MYTRTREKEIQSDDDGLLHTPGYFVSPTSFADLRSFSPRCAGEIPKYATHAAILYTSQTIFYTSQSFLPLYYVPLHHSNNVLTCNYTCAM